MWTHVQYVVSCLNKQQHQHCLKYMPRMLIYMRGSDGMSLMRAVGTIVVARMMISIMIIMMILMREKKLSGNNGRNVEYNVSDYGRCQ